MVRSACIVSTIDSHTAGEPIRLVTGGVPPLRGGTMAEKMLFARTELGLGDRFVSESIIGTRFTGQIIEQTQVGSYPAIIVRVSGRAHLTGFHQFVPDPEDPFPSGFSLDNPDMEGES
jgi:proline racemase